MTFVLGSIIHAESGEISFIIPSQSDISHQVKRLRFVHTHFSIKAAVCGVNIDFMIKITETYSWAPSKDDVSFLLRLAQGCSVGCMSRPKKTLLREKTFFGNLLTSLRDIARAYYVENSYPLCHSTTPMKCSLFPCTH